MEIQVGDKTFDVTLLEKEGNAVRIDINGTVYDADVAMLENGTCSIIYNGNSYKAELARNGEGGKHYKVNVNYSTYSVEMLDSQAKYMRMRKKSTETEQSDTITAPMPCKIVKIYCKAGDRLKAGDTALTMEAMKMQTNYKVTANCRVKKLTVAEGESARAGQILAELELDETKE